MRRPNKDELSQIAEDFGKKWDFPHCVGGIDGKHIRVKCPTNSGSMYFNYKAFYSIVLMAVVDAHYRFIVVDIGSYGKDSDGGVFWNTQLCNEIENGTFELPVPKNLPNSDVEAPFVFVGDEAFPLKSYLMKPYPRRQLLNKDEKSYFNYRLSRARMVAECAFGIIAAKFRILQKNIETSIDNANHIVKAICLLHNVIIDFEGNKANDTDIRTHYTTLNSILNSRRRNRPTTDALRLRELFTNYLKNNRI